MAGGSDPSIGGWLDHPMLGDFLFYFIFAAIARGPLAFATRWIWAACASRGRPGAAVRSFLGFRRSFPRWSRQARVDPR